MFNNEKITTNFSLETEESLLENKYMGEKSGNYFIQSLCICEKYI